MPLAETACELMFQAFADRAEKPPEIVTTNLPISEWSHVIPNPWLCKALIDRLTDQAHIITTGTDSSGSAVPRRNGRRGNHEREDSKSAAELGLGPLSRSNTGGWANFVSTSGPIFIVTATLLEGDEVDVGHGGVPGRWWLRLTSSQLHCRPCRALCRQPICTANAAQTMWCAPGTDGLLCSGSSRAHGVRIVPCWRRRESRA